ncbi:unnamed protein product [Phytophthora fragariaefolia]|uniref:Unnamed protein product n=1 Tax=Phytophthora fragariaefolia TaxID=1490495 RepID=A0A9W6WTA5_9STRA|nr:unnamed protein product [Phytophthora fragariaefolia]
MQPAIVNGITEHCPSHASCETPAAAVRAAPVGVHGAESLSLTSEQKMEADDSQALEAALCFVDEFQLEEAASEALSGLPVASSATQMTQMTQMTQIHEEAMEAAGTGRAARRKAPSRRSSSEEKRRRQEEINERRRLLRKTGVYGDSNRVRNERTREIAFLREQMGRLQLDLDVLQRRKAHEQSGSNASIDSVFAANGLTSMTISPDDVHVRQGVEGKYLEFCTYKDLPFTLQDVSEAKWDHFKGVSKHQVYGNFLDEPYTIIEDFSKEVYSNSSRADVKLKQVVRRYIEADRDIVIWVSRVTPVEVKHKLFRGLSYNFRGYAMTRRSPVSTASSELTQLQLCSLISLDHEECSTYDPDSVRALTNFLVVHAAKNLLAHRDSIENALTDLALSRVDRVQCL